jgi:hypothetical protein
MIDISIGASKAKAFDPFAPDAAGDPPPTLTDRQRAIVTTGTSLHLSRVFPGGEARNRRREPGRRSRF